MRYTIDNIMHECAETSRNLLFLWVWSLEGHDVQLGGTAW